jgi:hypothetical protein
MSGRQVPPPAQLERDAAEAFVRACCPDDADAILAMLGLTGPDLPVGAGRTSCTVCGARTPPKRTTCSDQCRATATHPGAQAGTRRTTPTPPAAPPTGWMADAACTGHDPHWWTADADPTGAARARRICAGCPVLAPCQRHGRTHETAGVWGGQAIDLDQDPR